MCTHLKLSVVVVETMSDPSQAGLTLLVEKDDFELLIFLPAFPECQDYRCAPACPVYVVWGAEPQDFVPDRQALYRLS